MPDESESVPLETEVTPATIAMADLIGMRAPTNHLLSPSLGIRLMSNQHPIPICSVIHSLFVFKCLCTLSLNRRAFISNAVSHLWDLFFFSPLPPFTYSLCPNWWMSSLDTTLTCICPPCLPLSSAPFFFLSPSLLGSLQLLIRWGSRILLQEAQWLICFCP